MIKIKIKIILKIEERRYQTFPKSLNNLINGMGSYQTSPENSNLVSYEEGTQS
jgi:hypothetical protein